jgi:tRNA 2-thiouridine synthesizing protein A
MEKDQTEPKKVVDCMGLFCPVPLLQAREAIDSVDVGDIIELITDDPAAEEDIKRFAKRTGHELLDFEKDEDTLRFLIKRAK